MVTNMDKSVVFQTPSGSYKGFETPLWDEVVD